MNAEKGAVNNSGTMIVLKAELKQILKVGMGCLGSPFLLLSQLCKVARPYLEAMTGTW